MTETEPPLSETAKKIAVMQAYEDGEKIQIKVNGTITNTIRKEEGKAEPLWQWEHYKYSIYEEPPVDDYIDWIHIHPDFKYMARNFTGVVYLHTREPALRERT